MLGGFTSQKSPRFILQINYSSILLIISINFLSIFFFFFLVEMEELNLLPWMVTETFFFEAKNN